MKKSNVIRMNQIISRLLTFSIMMTMFLNTYVCAQSTTGQDVVRDILTEVTTILLVVGGCVCVGKLLHIGILYMMSSATEKSNAKTAVLPWLLGTIVCFGASWIGPLIIDIFRVNTGSGGVLGSY